MQCKATNGYVGIGDIITLVGYWDYEGFVRNPNGNGYLYKIVSYQEYEGKPQFIYKRVDKNTLEVPSKYSHLKGDWITFDDAKTDVKLIQKRKNFLIKLIELIKSKRA